MDDRRRGGVGRIDRLRVLDQRQAEDPLARDEHVAQDLQVEPEVVGVEEGVTVLVGEEAHLVGRCLRGVAQDDAAVALAHRQVAALDVGRRAAAHLRGVGGAGGGEPAGDASGGGGPQIVRVGGHGVRVTALQQGVEDARGDQGGVDVAVPGRAPFEIGIRLPCHRGEVVGAQLGLAVLQEVQGQTIDLDAGVLGERRERVPTGAEGVHEDQRQSDSVEPARRHHLVDQQVEERLAVAHGQQRLGPVHPHGGAQTPVELDQNGARQRLAGVVLPDFDILDGVDPREGLDGVLGDQTGGPILQGPVVVTEDINGLLGDVGVAHLALGSGESVLAHGSSVSAERPLPQVPQGACAQGPGGTTRAGTARASPDLTIITIRRPRRALPGEPVHRGALPFPRAASAS